jgi:hypothetical protein
MFSLCCTLSSASHIDHLIHPQIIQVHHGIYLTRWYGVDWKLQAMCHLQLIFYLCSCDISRSHACACVFGDGKDLYVTFTRLVYSYGNDRCHLDCRTIAGRYYVCAVSRHPCPEGCDQPRLHWNTKNTTRFTGTDPAEVSSRVGRAVYPAGENGTSPDMVLLYNPEDWQSGLQAASLLKPLNAVLLPGVDGIAAEIERLAPPSSDTFDGAQVVTLAGAAAPEGEFSSTALAAGVAAAGRPVWHPAVLPDAQPPAHPAHH